ncbi:YceK/YidQ family lipoprotein [Musicola keenii]|uniref:YceK/YidQ family lipoprotein n=1 Tax=Musicola keenii TaxID=2884250 RepID=UPI001784E77F|nr:YceK/YidQ family lipoprotein [Musicola keenii]
MMAILKRVSLLFVLFSVIFIACSGCSSVMTHTGGEHGYYSGTRASMTMLEDDATGWVMKPALAVDLPFSAMLDTMLLPYDYYRTNREQHTTSARDRLDEYERQRQATNAPHSTPPDTQNVRRQ